VKDVIIIIMANHGDIQPAIQAMKLHLKQPVKQAALKQVDF